MEDYSSDNSDISLEGAVAKIEQLENENRQLVHELEECKDQLFELLQQENDIPEQQVKDEFIRIFDAVDSWIDDVSGDENFDFKSRYSKTMQRSDRRDLFKELGLEAECLEMPWAMKVGGLETSHYVVLSLAITHFIVTDIFKVSPWRESRDLFPPGISVAERGVIRRVESAMGSEPDTLKGDKSRYSKWRAETISALMSTEEYNDFSDKETKIFEEDLRTELQCWVDSKKLVEHFRSLHHKVLNPVYKFLHTVGCSSKVYQLSLERITPGSTPPDDGSWTFKDMATWRTVSSRDVIGSIRYLYPGLVRKGYGDQQDLLLVKPVILGYREPDLQLQLNTSQPRSRSFSPVKPNIIRVESGPTYPSRTEQRRSERHMYEASRSSGKAPRTEYGQKQPPQQASQDQPRTEHKQQKSKSSSMFGGLISRVQRPPGLGSRAQPHTSPKSDGRRLNKPQKAMTWHAPSPGAGEAEYSSDRQDGSNLYQGNVAATRGVVNVDTSEGPQIYGDEQFDEEVYHHWRLDPWEPTDGGYNTRPR
ncbi:hypothetical protein F5Y10DRAFT_174736 [Nemania abortiva]|nr:hypothetical protein F5Y10DRAFT_174736 [Nemania abortiva]